ncbi:MAG: c-type cytochrome [Burkholderiales bacterium]
MTRRLRLAPLPALLLLTGIAPPPAPGGWAVITVEDLPDYVVAGQPVTLTYSVRQHGQTLLRGLKGRIDAEAGRSSATAAASAGKSTGHYTATLTLPEVGAWTLTIRSGFGDSRVTLVPLEAIAAGTRLSRALPETERGRRLFVAKGCETCHRPGGAGPELAGRQLAADYVKVFIANPPATPRSGTLPMPNLGLKEPEITALATVLATERRAQR